MKETFTRLLDLVAYYSLDYKAFCAKIGFNYTTFMNYSTGTRRPNNLELYEKVLSTFEDISAEWLLRGEGEMLKHIKDIKVLSEADLISLIQGMHKEIVDLAKENGRMTAQIEYLRGKYKCQGTSSSYPPGMVAEQEESYSKED